MAFANSDSAQVNNNDALRLLLQYRADPYIRDFWQYSPIDHAVLSKEPSSMEILLQRGVRSVPEKVSNHTALHYAAYHHNDLGFIIPLVNAGCEIDLQASSRHTPLSRAVYADNDIVAIYLIDNGASINSRDSWGNTPLITAVQCGSTKVLRLLLERRADYNTVNSRGHTILHDAADFCSVNIETLNVLKDAGLRGIDTQARNSAGQTAMELMQQRSGVSDEFRVRFEALLESIKPVEPTAPIELSSFGRSDRPWVFNTIVAFSVVVYIMASLNFNGYWVGLLSCFTLYIVLGKVISSVEAESR